MENLLFLLAGIVIGYYIDNIVTAVKRFIHTKKLLKNDIDNQKNMNNLRFQERCVYSIKSDHSLRLPYVKLYPELDSNLDELLNNASVTAERTINEKLDKLDDALKLLHLEARLKEAVSDENYELAAVLSNDLNRLNKMNKHKHE